MLYEVITVSLLSNGIYTAMVTTVAGLMVGILEVDPNQVGRENFNTGAYLAGQYEGLVRENLP